MWRLRFAALLTLAVLGAGCNIIKAAPTPTTPTGTLQGVVTAPGGPVANAQVAVTASDATQHTGASNADGFYRITAIPVGPATYAVRANGYAEVDGSIEIAPDPGGTHQDVSLNPQ